LDDIAREALEAVDVAPWGVPGAEVVGQFVGGGGEGLQKLCGGGFGGDVVFGAETFLFGF